MAKPVWVVTRKERNEPYDENKFVNFSLESSDEYIELKDAYRWIVSRRVLHPNHFYEVTKHAHAWRLFVSRGTRLSDWMITPSDEVSVVD